MGGSHEEPLVGPGPTDGATAGWYSHTSDEAHPSTDEPEVRYVELRHEEYAGPFWDDQGHLSDEYDDLQRWLGISRELYDEAMAWNSEGGDWTVQQHLLRRLRTEVPSHIEVPPPRRHPPRDVLLHRLSVVGRDGERRLREDSTAGAEAAPLPVLPLELLDDLARWLGQRERFAYGDDEQAAAHFAWEDEGLELCRRLEELWGADYTVSMLA
jgi:hypothetical protein